jgi:hypothetical protein
MLFEKNLPITVLIRPYFTLSCQKKQLDQNSRLIDWCLTPTLKKNQIIMTYSALPHHSLRGSLSNGEYTSTIDS